MATQVIQLIPVDPSLQSNTDFASMAEYIIGGASGTGAGGTYYVLDNKAQIVYEWSQNTPGPNNVLINTGGSYTQFLSFLVSNPPIIVTNTASYPSTPVTANEQTVLLRGILLATAQLACQGALSDISDFYPQNSVLA